MEAPNQFPRSVLISAAILLGLTVTLAVGFRLTDQTPAAVVPKTENPVLTRSLRFEDRNGSVVVYEVSGNTETIIEVVESGNDGFLRSVMRGLARARRAEGVGADVPFQLSQRADGALFLEDPATDRHIYLRAFGVTNEQAFARLLTAQPEEALLADNDD